MADKNIETLQQEVEALKLSLKAREDEVGNVNARLAELQKNHEALKLQAGIKDAEQPGEVSITVLDAKTQKPEKKKVTIVTPFVRIDTDVVSSVALMKVAAGKALTEEEQEKSPALKTMSKEEVLQLLTKWASMQVGVLKISE